MEFIKLETLELNIPEKSDEKAREFIKKLCHDESIKKRFQGIMGGLFDNPNFELLGHAFLVSYNNEYIGYLRVGEILKDENAIYLRAAIDKDARGHNWGAVLLNEITEHIFQNYPEAESIRLKIAPDNIPSLKTAEAGGYVWLRDDFFVKYNPYLTESMKR